MEFIKSPLLESNIIAHGFFGRQGGVSSGLYDSLNCGLGTKDDRANVTENRRRVLDTIGADYLMTLYQEHTSLCVPVTDPWNAGEGPKADAVVTDVPGIALGVLTADCAPVLFSGTRNDGSPVIGAAHAGWRGAIGGVVENTLAQMYALGAVHIQVSIGPCIGPKSYEVSPGFEAPFLARDSANSRFFQSNHFDLPGYVLSRLKDKAEWCGIDTYIDDTDYFSYRRKTHKNEPDYGRQISVIAIKKHG